MMEIWTFLTCGSSMPMGGLEWSDPNKISDLANANIILSISALRSGFGHDGHIISHFEVKQPGSLRFFGEQFIWKSQVLKRYFDFSSHLFRFSREISILDSIFKNEVRVEIEIRF